MVSSSTRAQTADETGSPGGLGYFKDRRAKVNGFVARHFNWPGTFRLHGAAIGWDILRAPINVALSPILVLTRIAAYLCRRVGWRATADWRSRRRILWRTSVARRVGVLIVTDLLDLPLDEGLRPVIHPPWRASSWRRRSFAR